MASRIARIPPVRLALDVQRRYSEDRAGLMASGIAFHAFLSLFPMILLALSVIGFFLSDVAAQIRWVEQLSRAFPGLEAEVERTVRAVVRNRAGSGVIGLVGLAWSGRGVLEAASYALGRIARAEDRPGIVRRTLRSIVALAGLGALGVTFAAVTGAVSAADRTGAAGVLLGAAGWTAGSAVAFLLFLLAYGTLTRAGGVRRSWPGALLATAGWLALQLAGSLYVTRVVARASAVYGSLAAVVGLLVLMQLGSYVFLYGAELNAVLRERASR